MTDSFSAPFIDAEKQDPDPHADLPTRDAEPPSTRCYDLIDDRGGTAAAQRLGSTRSYVEQIRRAEAGSVIRQTENRPAMLPTRTPNTIEHIENAKLFPPYGTTLDFFWKWRQFSGSELPADVQSGC
jgi:hypothetical protein